MVVKKSFKFNIRNFFGFLFVTCSLLYSGLKLLELRRDFQKKTGLILNSLQTQSSQESNLREAYKKRLGFYRNLFSRKSSTKNQKDVFDQFKKNIEQVERIIAQNPLSLSSLEKAQNQLNQNLTQEIIQFNQSKLSLFNNIEQIRSLERYDRMVDLARSEYSDWTFSIQTTQEQLSQHQWRHFSQSPWPKELPPYFEVDHLIRLQMNHQSKL